MPSDQASALYGAPRPKKKLKSSGTDSSSMTFASHLTSLMTAPTKKPWSKPYESRSDSLGSKTRKDDIFSAHHKAKKQKRETGTADDGDATEQRHRTAEEIGGVDKDFLHLSKRKMEEKARIYAAMQRGDYVDPHAKRYGSSAWSDALAEERGPLVDFDRKWAEGGGKDPSSSSDNDQDSEEEEIVEYTDEYGRTRKGTRTEMLRATRKQRIAASAQADLDDMRGRPAPPPQGEDDSGVIYGDTVQSAAFNPDQTISEQMAALAAKRDRSLTPPPDTHFDGSKEVRQKGMGFYQFSQDKETRKEEMESLAAERAETEQRTKEREERRQKKATEMEARRQALRERRSKKEADAFLRGLELSDDFVPPSEEKHDD